MAQTKPVTTSDIGQEDAPAAAPADDAPRRYKLPNGNHVRVAPSVAARISGAVEA